MQNKKERKIQKVKSIKLNMKAAKNKNNLLLKFLASVKVELISFLFHLSLA